MLGGGMRYRLLETVRQYALEKLGESGDADAVRARHRDYYTAMAALLDARADRDYEQRIEQAETEIDNLRAAFAWSRDNSDGELALALASALQPLWLGRGRLREGLAWFDALLTDLDAQHLEVTGAVRARALADKAVLDAWAGAAASTDQTEQAVASARDVDDPALLARVLTACGYIAAYNAETAAPYFAEAIGLARESGDRWRLSQLLSWQAAAALVAGDPIAGRAAGQEGRDLAEAIGDRFISRRCRFCLGVARTMQGDLWPKPPHNSTRWPLRPRRLTTRSSGRTASRARAPGTVNLRSCGRSANHIGLIRHTRPGESRRRSGENRPRIAQVDSAR